MSHFQMFSIALRYTTTQKNIHYVLHSQKQEKNETIPV